MAHVLFDRAERTGWWFGLLAGLAFCGNALAGLAARLLAPDAALVWLAYALLALATAAIGTLAVERLVLNPFRRQSAELAEHRKAAGQLNSVRLELAQRLEWQRRLRHDLRGVLSPALLTADRLLTNADPKVQRAGNIMVQAVERSAALLAGEDD